MTSDTIIATVIVVVIILSELWAWFQIIHAIIILTYIVLLRVLIQFNMTIIMIHISVSIIRICYIIIPIILMMLGQIPR